MYKAKQDESLLSSRAHVLPPLYNDKIQGDHSRAKQRINFLYISERNTDKQLIDSSIFSFDCTMRVLLCRTLRKNKPKQAKKQSANPHPAYILAKTGYVPK